MPKTWSEAFITPIYKKDQRTEPSNYRPISLTSVPCKVMERFVRDAMLDFLSKNSLISPSQHGFVFSKSCLTNLVETLGIITDALSNGHEVIVVLLDFAKAFDKVSHEPLLTKLSAYGFCSEIIDWIQVLSGVPQGSVLGPLLFVIFINDMPDSIQHFCKLFADDIKLIATIKGIEDHRTLQNDLTALVS